MEYVSNVHKAFTLEDYQVKHHYVKWFQAHVKISIQLQKDVNNVIQDTKLITMEYAYKKLQLTSRQDVLNSMMQVIV